MRAIHVVLRAELWDEPRRARTMLRANRLAIPALLASLLGLACARNAPAHTVAGIEATDLLQRASGSILLDVPVGGLQAHHLPDHTQSTPIAPGRGSLPIHSVAGPGVDGRVAFIANDMVGKHHSLVMLYADGRRETVFDEPGDALWEHAVGDHLALSPDGRRVALVARTTGIQTHSPDAYLFVGKLEVWDVVDKRRVAAVEGTLDDTLAWFPDSSRLAYVRWLGPADAAAVRLRHVDTSDAFGASTSSWAHSPIVHELDLTTGASRPLHAGERPLVSPDGRSLLVRDFELHWRLLDLASDVSRSVDIEGAIYPGAIAFVDPHTVLFWSWPTDGATIEYTDNNSPLVGSKQKRALKLADLRDGRFQTVLAQVDPRRKVSYGP